MTGVAAFAIGGLVSVLARDGRSGGERPAQNAAGLAVVLEDLPSVVGRLALGGDPAVAASGGDPGSSARNEQDAATVEALDALKAAIRSPSQTPGLPEASPGTAPGAQVGTPAPPHSPSPSVSGPRPGEPTGTGGPAGQPTPPRPSCTSRPTSAPGGGIPIPVFPLC